MLDTSALPLGRAQLCLRMAAVSLLSGNFRWRFTLLQSNKWRGAGMSKSIKPAAAAGALLMSLLGDAGAAQAQRWDGWHGFGWGGGGFHGAILPGVGWRGGWGGDGGGWGRPPGWGRPWGWSYYRTGLPTHRGAATVSPDDANAGYDGCYQLRRAWTQRGWRRQWVDVCGGGGGWDW